MCIKPRDWDIAFSLVLFGNRLEKDVPRSNFLPSLSMAFTVKLSMNTIFEEVVAMINDAQGPW